MPVCEICGKETRHAKIVFIEGSKLTVCERCAGHGNVISDYGRERKVYVKRPRYRKEEKTFDVVADYDKIVRREREKRKWKQEELAKKVNEPASLIERIEAGKTIPSEKVARKLEKVLGVTLLEEVQNTVVEMPEEKTEAVTLGDIVKIRKRKS
ncbi:MAG: TIGR00270 family protein [Candidatus Diapherotrites archaeon]|nr:TIGR00270 family protein [Candidatus Diapherotrites archaeon]